MKIIKVIVDEMPEGCIWCDYHKGDYYSCQPNHWCDINRGSLRRIEDANARPDWCPLVEQGHESKWSMTIEKDGISEFITVKNELESESDDES